MFVIVKHKNIILNSDNISTVGVQTTVIHPTVSFYNENGSVVLNVRYETLDRALEVFDMLVNAIKSESPFFDFPEK